jgi:hypothetical protein
MRRVEAQQAGALVIQGGTLIDGTGVAPAPNTVVVIQGNRIAQVGRVGQVQVPAGAQIRNHLAFYPDRVDTIEEQPAALPYVAHVCLGSMLLKNYLS